MDASELRVDAAIVDEASFQIDLIGQVRDAWSCWHATQQILPVQRDQMKQAGAFCPFGGNPIHCSIYGFQFVPIT